MSSFWNEKNLTQIQKLFTRANLDRCASLPELPVWIRGGSIQAARFLGNIWVDGVGPSVVFIAWLYGNHHAVLVNGEGHEISFVDESYAHGCFIGDFGRDVYESKVMPKAQEWTDPEWPMR